MLIYWARACEVLYYLGMGRHKHMRGPVYYTQKLTKQTNSILMQNIYNIIIDKW